MAHDKRPLSPDLQIYRPQLTSVLSISHRVTGIALSVGTLLLVSWLLAAAAGPQAYSTVQGFMRSWLGLLVMFGWTFSLFFHLCNGIRHLRSARCSPPPRPPGGIGGPRAAAALS